MPEWYACCVDKQPFCLDRKYQKIGVSATARVLDAVFVSFDDLGVLSDGTSTDMPVYDRSLYVSHTFCTRSTRKYGREGSETGVGKD